MSFQPVINALLNILTEILDFLPHLVNGLIVLIIGYLISALSRWIVRVVLLRLHFEQLAERIGITGTLRNLGVRLPLAALIGQIVFFLLLFSFAISAFLLMGLTAVADLLRDVLAFIPRAISAAIIIIFGSMLARFLGETITTVTGNANITYNKALGKLIEYVLVAFVVVLAISTLGVDTTILTSALTILIAAGGLAIALTFAFGAREAARNVIAGHYIRQNFSPGQQLELGEYRGRLRSTAGTYSVLETGSEAEETSTLSLPNTFLLQNAVRSQGAPLNPTGQQSQASEPQEPKK